jgi:hypothetical protein
MWAYKHRAQQLAEGVLGIANTSHHVRSHALGQMVPHCGINTLEYFNLDIAYFSSMFGMIIESIKCGSCTILSLSICAPCSKMGHQALSFRTQSGACMVY